jgi:SAM-dependent methyltransferase
MFQRGSNAQYNLAAPNSLPIRIANYQRRVMYEVFLELTEIRPQETVLDVGVTSDRAYASSNYLEAWYPHKMTITALGLDDAGFLEELYSGVRFVRGNGLTLPFADESFDVVHSSAVLEHVGHLDRQARLVRECARVARRAVFMTTPNRWFPVEFHTSLPLLHWLPKASFRAIIRRLGLEFFADEENLNLMSRSELAGIVAAVHEFNWLIKPISLVGLSSNFIVSGTRRSSDRGL